MRAPDKQRFVTRNMLARLFKCSPRWIERLVSEHGMPKEGRDSYDFLRCAVWYASFLRTAIKRRQQGNDSLSVQLRRDRTRLVRAQADRAEFELRELLLRLVSADEFEVWESRVHAMMRERLLAMCGRLTPKIVSMNRTQIDAFFDAEARATLTEMAVQMETRPDLLWVDASQGDSGASA